ncbi:MAG: response regulator [Opitutales bacterium]
MISPAAIESANAPLSPFNLPGPLTICVADDEPGILSYFHEIFQDVPVTLFTTEDGETALDLVGVRHIDALMVDLALPGMSGYEVIDTLRNDEDWKDRRDTFIVAMTGNLWLEARHPSRSLGADCYLPKPISLAPIHSILQAVAQRVYSR